MAVQKRKHPIERSTLRLPSRVYYLTRLRFPRPGE